MNKINLLIIILVFAFTGIVNGQVDKKVAVFDPVGDVSQNLKIIIREELSNAVVNTLGFTVLERELINKVLAESQFQMTGHVDDGQIGELGKKMGANYVCYASISSVGGNYYISCKMVDVMTAKIERQNTGITQSGLDDLFTVVSTVSRAMLQQQGTNVKSTATKAKSTQPVYDVSKSNSDELTDLDMMGLSVLIMPIDISPTKITWMEANNACLESNSYGLNDWRLPTKIEISRMYAQKSALKKVQNYWYWSSTVEKGDNYFRQAFDADKLEPAAAKAKAFARCVHSNGTINLADADGIWEYSLYGNDYQVMPEDLAGEYRWEEANNACESSTAYGYNDWYLPSIDDLDFMYNNKIALNMIGIWYWSSTPKKAGSTSFMFEKNFDDGQRYDTGGNAKRQVRCIRKL
ncbi:MAG TPA: hypothetical protein DCG75_13805 [Bacteroidales bacterium]|jgi:hypothetical protein|nr:hypothetical protein [Bacteroidales bacterium]